MHLSRREKRALAKAQQKTEATIVHATRPVPPAGVTPTVVVPKPLVVGEQKPHPLTLICAIIGVVTGLLSLGWQLVQWQDSRTERVKIVASNEWAPDSVEYRVVIANLSGIRVYLTEVGMHAQNHRHLSMYFEEPDKMNISLEPGESRTFSLKITPSYSPDIYDIIVKTTRNVFVERGPNAAEEIAKATEAWKKSLDDQREFEVAMATRARLMAKTPLSAAETIEMAAAEKVISAYIDQMATPQRFRYKKASSRIIQPKNLTKTK